MLDDLGNLDDIFNNKLSKNLRRDIRLASKIITVSTSDDIQLFYRINMITFDRQGMEAPYDFDSLKCIRCSNCWTLWMLLNASRIKAMR